jgi:hypothetical protein
VQLTGGGGIYNINNGVIAHDAITFDNATSVITKVHTASNGQTSVSTSTQGEGPLSFKGLFGCAEAYKMCTPDSGPDCVSQASNCPTGNTPSSLFQGSCPGSGNGIEASWTFNVGGPASAMAVPEQVFKAGLISKKVVSWAWYLPMCGTPIHPA